MKFCKDCKHRMPYPGDESIVRLSTCALGRKGDFPVEYLVTAQGNNAEFEFCTTMRQRDPTRAGCGQDGVLWEAVPSFKIISVQEAKAAGLI